MTSYKFKEGDMVKVVKNTSNGFPVGHVGTVTNEGSIRDGEQRGVGIDNRYVHRASNLELATSTSTTDVKIAELEKTLAELKEARAEEVKVRPFKVGDKVKCIDWGYGTSEEVVGKIFTVVELLEDTRIKLDRCANSSYQEWSDEEGFELYVKPKIKLTYKEDYDGEHMYKNEGGCTFGTAGIKHILNRVNDGDNVTVFRCYNDEDTPEGFEYKVFRDGSEIEVRLVKIEE